jgi:hypothetical protein
MGTFYREHKIRCFRPDDTPDEFYVECNDKLNVLDILTQATEKWPFIKLSELQIEALYIHTDCIGYDAYDPSDYTRYLCISRKKSNV